MTFHPKELPMTLADRLIRDRLLVTRHPRFVGSETVGPLGDQGRVMWRELTGGLVKTPWGPTVLAWAVAAACLEIDDETQAELDAVRARGQAFEDEEGRL